MTDKNKTVSKQSKAAYVEGKVMIFNCICKRCANIQAESTFIKGSQLWFTIGGKMAGKK